MKAVFIGDIFVGDLQETITRSPRDNQGGYNRKRLVHGILAATLALRAMISVVFEFEGLVSYITRESLSKSIGGRGISHILVSKLLVDMYVGGCVDPIVSASFINTDHHIVAADFDFSFQARTHTSSKPEDKFHWNRISKIQVDMDKPIPQDPNTSPSITLKEATSWTKEFMQNKDLYDNIQELTMEGSALDVEIASPFLHKMETIQRMLQWDSQKLSLEEQQQGVLIPRRSDIKEMCNLAVENYMRGLKMLLRSIKLKKTIDPIGKVQKHISRIQQLKEQTSMDGATISFTQLLEGINRAIANTKALRRSARKIRHLDPSSPALRDLMRNVVGYAAQLMKLSDAFDLEGQLARATFHASSIQEDREIIQETLGKHRNLNPFGGEHLRTQGTNIYSTEETHYLNVILEAAGVDNRIQPNNSSVRLGNRAHSQEAEGGDWCQITAWIKQADKGRRWIDILSEKAFLDKVDDTITHLKRMKSQACYRRRKAKLLATQHAGLTMTTGTLKRLFNPQPREMPEPQHMIQDSETGEMRPCNSIEENGTATREHHQRWMDESDADIQCLFGELTRDDVGVCGAELNTSMTWIESNVSKGLRNYNEVPHEGQLEYLRAHELLAPIFITNDRPIKALGYPFYYDCVTGEFSDPAVRRKFYDSIIASPGKARDEGFTLHVLARLPSKWREGMLLFIQNVLPHTSKQCRGYQSPKVRKSLVRQDQLL